VRINRVILENYGLFADRNEIDLIPRGEEHGGRPIILIGGMNGSGKTTLLAAVRLALYGKNAVGYRLSEKRYHEHLRNAVHRSRNALIQRDYARVGVEFDFVSQGNRDSYFVERYWVLRNADSVQETLQIYKRGSTSQDGDYTTWPVLADLEPEYWQSFVSDIVPERLSQLFFFDGEKIKRIADDISGDAAVAESIHSLLGLDTVGRLKADLTILATREARKYMHASDTTALDRLTAEMQKIQTMIAELHLTRAALETAIRGTEAEILRLEIQLQEQGGAFALNRQQKRSNYDVLEAEIGALYRRIRSECEGSFPLSLTPSLVDALRMQLKNEALLQRGFLIRGEISSLEMRLVKNVSDSMAPELEATRQKAIAAVRNTIAEYLQMMGQSTSSLKLLDLSEMETEQVESCLRDAVENATQRMRSLCNELESKEREIQNIRRELDRAPEAAVLAPAFDKVRIQNQVLGRKKGELTALDERIDVLERERAAKERERDRLLRKGGERAASKRRVELMGNAKCALDAYLLRLTEMKITSLCETATHCFNVLSRKNDLIHNVSINPSTFEIGLRDRFGHTIPREELSAGEKQILAISLLWGLARTSGRPLPVIIDTPLGRLDSDHRLNLVEHYYPYAGHQVILLSTDTEVDRQLFLKLKPHISHSYNLFYDKDEQRTRPRRNYFWKEPLHA